jgi:hypothetical protein
MIQAIGADQNYGCINSNDFDMGNVSLMDWESFGISKLVIYL